MRKKVLAFDLDGTLAITKSPLSDRMGEIMTRLLDKYDLCVISGGGFEQFTIQVVNRLESSPIQLRRLHLMPTCGTRYYRYNESDREWDLQYAEDLTLEEKKKIIKTLEESAKELGLWEENPAGDIIEDRLSQITFSALGQQATAEDKHAWDPDGSKKKKLRDAVAVKLPALEVRVGGTTSVDITRANIDKAHGMRKLIDTLDVSREEILFFGDQLQEGGNDYPVKAMGIDSIQVDGWEDTARCLEAILYVS